MQSLYSHVLNFANTAKDGIAVGAGRARNLPCSLGHESTICIAIQTLFLDAPLQILARNWRSHGYWYIKGASTWGRGMNTVLSSRIWMEATELRCSH